MWICICVDGVAHNSRLKFSIISFVVHCRKFRAEWFGTALASIEPLCCMVHAPFHFACLPISSDSVCDLIIYPVVVNRYTHTTTYISSPRYAHFPTLNPLLCSTNHTQAEIWKYKSRIAMSKYNGICETLFVNLLKCCISGRNVLFLLLSYSNKFIDVIQLGDIGCVCASYCKVRISYADCTSIN